MNEPSCWTVMCQKTEDGSDDVIVDLPPELLARFRLSIGEELTKEVVDGMIVLKPTLTAFPTS